MEILSAATALGAVVAPFGLDYQSRRHRVPPATNNGFINDPSQSSQSRRKVLMDAIAILCVSKATGQVIAAGAQIRHEGSASRVRITLAGNDGDGLESARIHLLQLWPLLQQYSTLCQVARQTNDPLTNWPEYRRETPPQSPMPDLTILQRTISQNSTRDLHENTLSSAIFAGVLNRTLGLAGRPMKIYDVSITFSLP